MRRIPPLAALAVVASAGLFLAFRSDSSSDLLAQTEPSSGERTGLTPIRPQESRRDDPVDFPAGEHLLFQILQAFADKQNEEIWVVPEIPPDAIIELDEELTRIDLATLGSLLEPYDLTITPASRRGRRIHIVSKGLEKPANRKRGRLVRSGEPKEEEIDPGIERRVIGAHRARDATIEVGRVGEAKTFLDEIGSPDIRVFQRVDGESHRYLVSFETDSREIAEDVARTIAAILRSEIDKSRAGSEDDDAPPARDR